MKKKQAIWAQLSIEAEFGIDLANFQLSEIERLSTKLAEFVAIGVETEDLEEVDNYPDTVLADFEKNHRKP